MTATAAQSSPSRRIVFRRLRFVAVAAACAVLGWILVEFVQPERRFEVVDTVAEIQIRVVPKLAPTPETLERRILSNEALVATWNEIRSDVAGQTSSSSKSSARESELARWRSRLRIELDGEPSDDRRSVRVIWSGLDDLALGTSVVELLAERYADDLSADRWYGSIDRLRTKIKGVEIAASQLLKSARTPEQIGSGVSASGSQPYPDDLRYRDLLARRAALAATMQTDHPELQAAEAAVEEAERSFASPPVVVLTSALDGPEAAPIAPRLIAPNSATSLPPSGSRSSATPPVGNFAIAGDRLEKALAELQTQMDDVLLPREAEFPVVTLDRVGLHVGHLRPFWYIGVGLLSLIVSTAVSISRSSSQQPNSQPAEVMETPVAETAVNISAQQSASDVAVSIEPPTEDVAADELEATESPSDPFFRNESEVEMRLAAPVLAVVTRRRKMHAAKSKNDRRRAA
jgi:hypothetical protein